MSLNKVMLIANVGADPEVRYTEGGGKVAHLNVATTERFKDRNGEQKENTEWHSVSVWGKTTDFVENYVKKGSQLFIEGKLRTRKYTDKSGVERSVTEIVAENIQLLGSRQSSERQEAPAQRPSKPAFVPDPVSAKPTRKAPSAPVQNISDSNIDDDLPF